MSEETQEDKETRENAEHKIIEHIVKVQNENPKNEDTENALLKDKLAQKDAQLESLALKEFEEQKSELVESVRKSLGDEKAEEVAESITNTQELKSVTTMYDILQSGLQYGKNASQNTGSERRSSKGKLSGRAPLVPSDSVLTGETSEEIVNKIYDSLEEQLYLRETGRNYDANKLQKCENLQNKLLRSMVGGIKNRRNSDTGKWIVTQCRGCGKILTGGESRCPECDRPILLEQRGV